MYLDKTQSLNPRGQGAQSLLQVSTVRSFEGGLNVTDTDLNMSPKFAKVLDNLERDIDGSNSLRPGTKLLTNRILDTSNIVNHVYYNGFILTVQTSGNICTIDGAGNVKVKFLNDVLNAPPWPPGVTFVDFTIFNGDLIITNGRDPALIIESKDVTGHPIPPDDPTFMRVKVLVDRHTGSNVAVPIARFVIAHAQYTVFAGDAKAPSTIYISAKGTSGTFAPQTDPADAVNVDLGPRVSLGSNAITGLVAYRDKLLVTFERGVLPVNLGVTKGTPPAPVIHDPTDDGFIEEFGCLSHRSLVSVGDDTFFADNVGVNSINRVNVFNTLRPVRASHLIDPLITAAFAPLTQAQIDRFVFAVYDLRHFRYMLFIPVMGPTGAIVETICFSYTNIPTLKIQAWARLRGWIWQSGARTALQNVVFSRGNKLYSYDFDNPDGIAADRLGDFAVNNGLGEDIAFEWELPWADFKHRMDIKQMRYLGMDTQGEAKFTVEAYVDNLVDQKGTRIPLLSMDFVGGDAGGYGNSPYGDNPYGGGRDSSDERLYAFVAKFKLLKLRFIGSTKRRLKFISISIAYLHGSIRR